MALVGRTVIIKKCYADGSSVASKIRKAPIHNNPMPTAKKAIHIARPTPIPNGTNNTSETPVASARLLANAPPKLPPTINAKNQTIGAAKVVTVQTMRVPSFFTSRRVGTDIFRSLVKYLIALNAVRKPTKVPTVMAKVTDTIVNTSVLIVALLS